MESFDYIVIGGGSGGSAVAGRLAVDGTRRVCLLEAGGRNNNFLITTPGFMPFIRNSSNYKFDTLPQAGLNGRTGYQPRGRGLGGSSAINAMLYLRGNRWDYDNWADMGCDGWSYDDVLPWFRKAEANERGADEYHGAGGPLFVSDQTSVNPTSHAFLDAASELQLRRNDDFNGERQEGFGLYQVTQRGGERWSASRGYVEPLREQGNFHIRTDTLVERLVIEDGRVTGVEVRVKGERQTLHARRGVILSAGTFGSPQILMLSGIGPAEHLRSFGIEVKLDRLRSRREPAGSRRLRLELGYDVGRAHRRHAEGDVAHGGSGIAAPAQPDRRDDHALCRGRRVLDSDGRCPRTRRAVALRPRRAGGSRARERQGLRILAPCLRAAARKPRDGSPGTDDAAAPPWIDPNFLDDDRDIAVLRKGVRLSHRIVDTPPMQVFGPSDRHEVDLDDDAALDHLIRNRADTVYHPVGTCRMGSDEDAVVDPTLKLNGLDGLWIADASVMPKIVSGNTNAPSIMIGERGADFVMAAEKA